MKNITLCLFKCDSGIFSTSTLTSTISFSTLTFSTIFSSTRTLLLSSSVALGLRTFFALGDDLLPLGLDFVVVAAAVEKD